MGGWHLTRLTYLVADLAEGAPWAPFFRSFPPEAAASKAGPTWAETKVQRAVAWRSGGLRLLH